MQALWMRLENFFAAQQWPVALRPGASEAEIADEDGYRHFNSQALLWSSLEGQWLYG